MNWLNLTFSRLAVRWGATKRTRTLAGKLDRLVFNGRASAFWSRVYR